MSNKTIGLLAASLVLALLTIGTTGCGVVSRADRAAQAAAQAFEGVTPTAPAVPNVQAPTTPPAGQGSGGGQGAANSFGPFLQATGLQAGVVTTNDGNTLGLKLGANTYQLQVAPTALIVTPGKSNASISDIQVGDRVIAKGADANAGSGVTFLLDFPKGYTTSNLILAAVQSTNNGTLTLRTRQASRNVVTNSSTVVVNIISGQPSVETLNDLKQGNIVLVLGTGSSDTFNAQVIVLLDSSLQNLQRNGRARPTPTPNGGT